MAEKIIVGFVGLGDQGAPIAGRILAGGYPLHIWARRPDAVRDLTAAGATLCASKAALAERVDVVGICVGTDAQLRDVLLGPEGLLAHLRPGKIVMIHTTALPQTIMELHAKAQEVGVALLDAPVSGGNAGARAGTMTLMIGGDEAVLERVRPILATFATKIVHLGGPGRGQVMKLLNNSLTFANLSTAIAGLQAAAALGIDQRAAADIISTSSGASFSLGLLISDEMFARLSSDSNYIQKDADHFSDVLAEAGVRSSLSDICGRTAAEIMEFAKVRFRESGEDLRPTES